MGEMTMERFEPYAIEEGDGFEGLLMGEIKAGFPSPAEDIREKLNLTDLLVRHKASTFFFRVDGVSMVDAGMDEGDVIIVDRALEPSNGCLAVCFLDGEFTVKRVSIGPEGVFLLPANAHNPKYRPIPVSPEDSFAVWGVVTYIIKKA